MSVKGKIIQDFLSFKISKLSFEVNEITSKKIFDNFNDALDYFQVETINNEKPCTLYVKYNDNILYSYSNELYYLLFKKYHNSLPRG